ncbi:DUF4188 domain-containing protein [Pseudoroseicyclus aestuarii]|uniref:Uncharacterized protein DUF4188 n=1 Tax=Pseudoroseicyclus aestuarii TaxID=1795041 RepID=A0A318SN46_9RHOB|nr:DUF4188 domain-containing protein [Pseudoroseicyclus aestuarii]PYE81282.1 uncharacterized protein DUF4188 [Pseudoroseicyclus aestuarii]
MADVIDRRMSARIEGDFVLFLIGIRINKPLKVHKWLPAVLAMPRMLAELQARPPDETGLLGTMSAGLGTVVQYWRSFDHLERYARDPDRAHYPAWIDFNRRMKGSRGDVGIWHETYLVRAGAYETVYSGMPPHGLGRAGQLAEAVGRRSEARSRLGGA